MNDYFSGKKYQFNYEFWETPHGHGFVNLLQIGEVHCVKGYEGMKHVQMCHEITYVTIGEGESLIDGTSYKIKAGDVIITRKGEQHQIVTMADEGLHFFYVGFTINESEAYANLSAYYNEATWYKLFSSTIELHPLFQMLVNEFYYHYEYADELITSLLQQIVVGVYRMSLSVDVARAQEELTETSCGANIYSIIKYIDKNYENIDSILTLSQDLGYSYNYFSRMFREKTGVTVRDYINKKRIERGISLIESGQFSIVRVSSMVGYETVQSFSKAFKRVMKVSPREYREQLHTIQQNGEDSNETN